MYVPSEFQPSSIHKFADNGIEAVSACVQLPNAANMQIAVIYRSPNVPLAMLITLLTRLLIHVSQFSMPCVILGDFNENVLHQRNSTIVKLMADFSFTQVVSSPPTTQATLLDHVYYRNPFVNPEKHATIHVLDTYYSDHDCLLQHSYHTIDHITA